MIRAIKILPVAIVMIAAALIATKSDVGAAADTPPVGTYARTCSNVSFASTGNDRWLLKATCKNRQGGPVQTQLVYDIANCDGNLKWAPTGC